MSQSFRQVYEGHEGKVSDKWSLYLDELDQILTPYRGQEISLLEIGIQNGGSLEILAKYFINAKTLVGCDIDPKCEQLRFTDERISVIIGDANSEECAEKIVQRAPSLDIIIDDGSHQTYDVIRSFSWYFPVLADDGVYIVEDLHSSYWEPFGGGLHNPLSSMAFFKRLADIINFEHWRNNKPRMILLSKFSEEFGIEFNDLDLARIHSIEFINSLCIVKKKSPENNVLGKRTIVGMESVVNGDWNKLSGTTIQDFNTVIKDDSNLEVFALLSQVDALTKSVSEKDTIIRNLVQQHRDQEQQIEGLSTELIREKEQNARISQELKVEKGEKTSVILELTTLKDYLDQRERNLKDINSILLEIYSSTAWRIIQFLWKFRLFVVPHGSTRELVAHKISDGLKKIRKRGNPPVANDNLSLKVHVEDDYLEWMHVNEADMEELKNQRKEVNSFTRHPLISIVVPVFNTPIYVLREMIESILSQTYPNWELCIANGSPDSADINNTLKKYSKRDRRIKIIQLERNLGIAGNTNAAIQQAEGDFIGFLDHDDLLAPFALFEVAKTIIDHPTVDLIYSDEDKISKDGQTRYEPFFKPAFSPDFLRSINYICHLLVIRRGTGEDIGWLRVGYEGAQDYDMVLRAAEKAKQIAHIPKILYHWRACSGSTASSLGAKDYATESGIKAIQEHLARIGLDGKVGQAFMPTSYRVSFDLHESPLVSIIIPNKDHGDELTRCISSIFEKSSYKNFEILILENNSENPTTFSTYEELKQNPAIRVYEYTQQPFNYSRINNWGATLAQGDILLFMNNDMEVINPDWLECMLEYILRPDVGVVGAKLYYPNDTVQHGGVVIGIGGVAGHAHKYYPRASAGYFNRLMLPQNVSAVTAACLMSKRKVFDEVGGFDPGYRLAFGDIDFCMKVQEKGYLLVWTPYAELYHHESKTRGFEDTTEKQTRFGNECALFKQNWSADFQRGDDYYNPNLTLSTEDFRINTNNVEVSARIKPGFWRENSNHNLSTSR